jgi:hypothetical protein
MWQGSALDIRSLQDHEMMLDDRVIDQILHTRSLLRHNDAVANRQLRVRVTESLQTAQLLLI